jgi:primosomal protein N' (replication factor Y) (superfamily II helicase)
MFAEVILSKVTSKLDRIFHYAIPGELEKSVQIGSLVSIPFGRRQMTGYVVGLVEQSDVKGIKNLNSVISDLPLFSEKQVELAKWISNYYCSYFSSALKLMMPPGGKRRAVTKPVSSFGYEVRDEFELTDEQNVALKEIKSAIDAEHPEKFLLYGVTGSGKTEVYLQTIAYLLKKEKSSIMLVPEISLTPQMNQRFKDRFGDQVAVLHSHLTLKQRGIEWERIATGESKIVVGARSALFAPVRDLGLIVIDEEYENSYKQDKNPRYHVREVSFFLARQHNAIVILGSATPSIDTYFQTEQGTIKKLTLSKRIDDRKLPPVEVVDMRKNKEFLLSKKLKENLRETIARGEQAILFINRRGFFTYVMCKECGYSLQCPECSVSLTYHANDKNLQCNRCGYSINPPTLCPKCNSSSLTYFGTGTQRIEKEIEKLLPQARIIRYDRDSVSKRGSHEELFNAFADKKADILIGTQMVAKGLDLANVTLVGVISADTALRLPDFRAAERTFQLLTQVAGRAGRHHLPGKVIIQTYDPDNYAIQTATQHDYDQFFSEELKRRQELFYPPYSKLISLLFSGVDLKKVMKIADDAKALLSSRIESGILGPAPAVITRLRGNWRYQILLKGDDLDKLRSLVVEALSKLVVPIDIRLAIDVEPMSML